MGHNTLSRIPGTKSWRMVVALLDGPATTSAIISASAKAAERDLLRAADDPVFVEAVRLLLSIPLAARSQDFGLALRDADIPAPDRPELIDIVAAATERLDAVAWTAGSRADFGELAARALTSTLSTAIGDALPGLFGATPEEVQAVVRGFSRSQGISEFSRKFFGNLMGGSLSYWLDRTLSTQIGPGLRFADARDRSAFDVELAHFASEATRIIKEFSGGWYGATLHREGAFGTKEARVFGAVALKKIVEELRVRNAHDD